MTACGHGDDEESRITLHPNPRRRSPTRRIRETRVQLNASKITMSNCARFPPSTLQYAPFSTYFSVSRRRSRRLLCSHRGNRLLDQGIPCPSRRLLPSPVDSHRRHVSRPSHSRPHCHRNTRKHCCCHRPRLLAHLQTRDDCQRK